jgi:DNA-binding PadR family transcriptional regulator
MLMTETSSPFEGSRLRGPRHHGHRGDHAFHHQGERRGRRHGRHSDRASRGDVRAAVLLLLAESPMHGYQLMQEIEQRTEGAWRPSPGAVYPTLALLEDEGYLEITRAGSRQLATLTDSGRAYLEEHREEFGDPFAAGRGREGSPQLRELVFELAGAVRQVGRSGDPAQVEAATALLIDARRRAYLILAGEAPGGTPPGGSRAVDTA